MIVIVENQNLPRAERYTVFIQGIDGIRARLLSGPTAEIAMGRLRNQEVQIEQEVIARREGVDLPLVADEDLNAINRAARSLPDLRDSSWETLTPAQYAARYADRVPWKSPTGGVR